jgi:hypothetical protein
MVSVDATMRAITGKIKIDKNAASIKTVWRFKTEVFAYEENIEGLE